MTGAAAFVLVIGYADIVTGPALGLSLFYIVPVAFAAWTVGRRAGIALGVLATSSWAFAELWWEHDYPQWISWWNAFTRLVIYSGAAVLIAQLQADRDRFAQLLSLERQLSRTDLLTGLPNLRSFLEEAHGRRRGDDGPMGCLAIDIDNFKQLNDLYGHQAGDECLMSIARVIRGAVRASDVAARIGGDEFGVVVRGSSREDIGRIGARIIDGVARVATQFPAADIGVSIGAIWLPRLPDDVEQVRRRADEALYEAKGAGKNRVVIGPAIDPERSA